MNDQELIALLHESLPHDLTERQITALRGAIQSSDEVRIALLDELHLEQALATRLAPELAGPEHLMTLLHRLDTRRRRARWRWAWMLLLGVIVLGGAVSVGVGVYVVYVDPPQIAILEPVPSKATEPNGDDPPKGGEQDSDGEPMDVDAEKGRAPNGDGNDGDKGAPTIINAPPQVAAPAPDPAWRIFDDPAARKDYGWWDRVSDVIKNRDGSSIRGTEKSHNITLDGEYWLAPPTEQGRVVRLRLDGLKKLKLSFHFEDEMAIVERDGNHVLRGSVGHRTKREKIATLPEKIDQRFRRQPVNYLANDSGRHRFYGHGAIDFRYQDGEVLVARGDIVLLALPMSQPPTEVTIDVQGNLKLAELLRLDPLPRRADRAAQVEWLAPRDGESTAPAALAWAVEPTEMKQEVERTENADGSVTFRRKKDSDSMLWAMTSVDASRGAEVIMELDEATPYAGIAFGGYGRRNTFVVIRQPDGDVLAADPYSPGNFKRLRASVGLVDRRFFCRIRYGFRYVQVDVSNTGRDWRELHKQIAGHPARMSQQMKVGIALFRGKGPRSIRMRSIRIRYSTALENLANAALVRRARAVFAELPDIWKSGKPEVVWTAIDAHCPSDVAIAPWRMAGYVATLRSTSTAFVKTEAALRLVETAVAANVEFDALLAAFAELPRLSVLPASWTPRGAWKAIHVLWDSLAAREAASGRGDHLKIMLDAWYRLDHGPGGHVCNPIGTMPAGLVRLCLYEAWARHDIESVRRIAMRYYYFERHGSGSVDHPSNIKYRYRLADWMLRAARKHFRDMPVILTSTNDHLRSSHPGFHPMAIDSDRRAANTIAEFMIAVDERWFADACRLLTTRSLPAGVVTRDVDSELGQAALVLLRDQIDANPEIVTMLKQEYQSMGEVRLRQLTEQGDYEGLESLATQFYGTHAATQAVRLLADRDLATGNFLSAAARYDALAQQDDVVAIDELKAKRRLALAMTGQRVGDRVTQSVRLSDQTMSPVDFEQMVDQLVAKRSSNVGPRSRLERSHLGPSAAEMRLSQGALVSVAPAANRAYYVAWNMDDRHVAIHSRDHISLLDRKGETLIWQKAAKPSSGLLRNSTFAPILLTDGVVFAYRSKDRVDLACFDLSKGTERWRQSLGAGVASDPLLIGSWIYVVSIEQWELNGRFALVLHRLSPRTGESVLARRLLELRTVDDVPITVGRPLQVNGTLLVRTAGAVVCCDLMGNTRWVRRLPFVPPTADPALTEGRPPMAMSVNGQRVLVTSVGSPMLSCLDANNGNLVWARPMPDAQNIVGATEDQFIVAFPNQIVAIQSGTGDVAWSQSTTADPQSILIANDGTVLTVTLDPIDRKDKHPLPSREGTIRWLSAKKGQVVRSVDLNQEAAELLYRPRLISDGRVVLGLAHVKGNTKQMKLFLIEPE